MGHLKIELSLPRLRSPFQIFFRLSREEMSSVAVIQMYATAPKAQVDVSATWNTAWAEVTHPLLELVRPLVALPRQRFRNDVHILLAWGDGRSYFWKNDGFDCKSEDIQALAIFRETVQALEQHLLETFVNSRLPKHVALLSLPRQ